MKKIRLSFVPSILLILLITFLLLSIIYKINPKQHNLIEHTKIVNLPYFDKDKFINKDGRISYEDDNLKSVFGIDISEFQENIDWKKLQDDGVGFVYMRIGRRGATTGILYLDSEFEKNYEEAKECGMKIGVYFFSQAINSVEARQEARFVAKLLKHRKIDFPVVYDCEEVYLQSETPRTANLSKEVFTENALAFCKEIEDAGYQAMIYTYPYWSENLYDMEKISQYPIWYAQYDVDVPEIDYPIVMWQYTNKGKIDGIDVDVDFNIMFEKK